MEEILWVTDRINNICGAAGSVRIVRGGGGRNDLRCHFVSNESYMTWPGVETGQSRREAGD